ncbi:MAG: Ferritin [uncultured Sulfurovum sp.]|uniref:Ferritin n=1 Tax=uncultured Sulfurovum sp. TaxID=269237 RepID=A0A6S6TJJ6_9BACT|nr:MAG: Ferritin [uncultured Sulfurovum sp.]
MTQRGNVIIKALETAETIRMLNKVYADSWLAYHQYLMEAKVVKGIRKSDVKAKLRQLANDELRHVHMISDRIIELGSTPIDSPSDWTEHTNTGYETSSSFDELSILDLAIKSAEGSVYVYSGLAAMLQNKDIITYELVNEILADEVENEEDLQELYNHIEKS